MSNYIIEMRGNKDDK